MVRIKNRAGTVDPDLTWITISEAAAAWEYSTKHAFYWAHEKGHIRMHKSGKTVLVNVADCLKHFGNPVKDIRYRQVGFL